MIRLQHNYQHRRVRLLFWALLLSLSFWLGCPVWGQDGEEAKQEAAKDAVSKAVEQSGKSSGTSNDQNEATTPAPSDDVSAVSAGDKDTGNQSGANAPGSASTAGSGTNPNESPAIQRNNSNARPTTVPSVTSGESIEGSEESAGNGTSVDQSTESNPPIDNKKDVLVIAGLGVVIIVALAAFFLLKKHKKTPLKGGTRDIDPIGNRIELDQYHKSGFAPVEAVRPQSDTGMVRPLQGSTAMPVPEPTVPPASPLPAQPVFPASIQSASRQIQDGTKNYPIGIVTPQDLWCLVNWGNDEACAYFVKKHQLDFGELRNRRCYFVLANDIDLRPFIGITRNGVENKQAPLYIEKGESGWVPDLPEKFTDSEGFFCSRDALVENIELDGQGHTIRGLVGNDPERAEVGLFSSVAKCTIRNVNLDGSCLLNGKRYVGSLVGVASFGSVIENCTSLAYVQASEMGVGGLVGKCFYQCTVKNCKFGGTVSCQCGKSFKGKLVGSIDETSRQC